MCFLACSTGYSQGMPADVRSCVTGISSGKEGWRRSSLCYAVDGVPEERHSWRSDWGEVLDLRRGVALAAAYLLPCEEMLLGYLGIPA